MVSIKLSNLSLSYPIYGMSARSLKKDVVRIALGKSLNVAHETVMIDALKEIDTEIHSGQRVGLVGHNGAGKSTLLKVLAGIYAPTSGIIQTEGTVGALFDTHFGIDFDATGYENIYIRSYLLGLSSQQIPAMIKDVEEFTELGEFLAMPVKSYSAGMTLRLSFALSTMQAPQILLIDEIINVGDASFIEKTKKRLADFVHRSEILVLASHSNEIIRSMCNNLIWLEKGRIKKVGLTSKILPEYINSDV